ncbi:MAG: NUDIX hydrolase [Thermomicrobiales bacterium]
MSDLPDISHLPEGAPIPDNRLVGNLHCQRCGGVCGSQVVEGRERPVCADCGFVIYQDPKLAVAVVIERDGQFLLGLRGPGVRAPGKWSFPAGYVERGEVVEVAAIREAREETGLTVELGSLLALISAPGEPVVLAVFPAASFTGDPTPNDDLLELGWFTPDSLPELAFPSDRRIIAALDPSSV